MKKILLCNLFLFSQLATAATINEFSFLPGRRLTTDGKAIIDLDLKDKNLTVKRSFFGADTHGFSKLPRPSMVNPLELGVVKFGGSLHSTYNWELNAYFDNGIYYVYSPLERRIQLVKKGYGAAPMFQVNMLGWQPDRGDQQGLVFSNTATPDHAAAAILYLNGEKKLGLEHVLMGNEPFESMEVHKLPVPSADEYIDQYIHYATALRSAQEKISGNPNDIKLWGPEIATGWTGWQTTHPKDCTGLTTCSYGNGQFKEFMPYFLFRLAQFEKDNVKNPKHYKMLDVISWHYYPLFRKKFSDRTSIIKTENGDQNVAAMLESVDLWDSETYVNKFDYASPRGIAPKIIKRFGEWRAQFYPNAKLAVTEFAVDSVANIDYHPIVRPLYLADLMGRLASNGVDTFINSFLQSGETAASWSLIDKGEKSNLYQIFSLYSQAFKGSVLSSSDSFGDLVNIYAVKNEESINIFMVNKDKHEHTPSLNFKLNGNLDEITDITLPAWSLTVLTVNEDKATPIKVRQFGAKEMGISIE